MNSATTMTGSYEPLRILSLDGGGIRGISSLLILERIMEKIRDAEHLDHVPRPCDRFDLIGGTSTGGIIAIMLGRLGMTVDECIRAYRQVAQQAFSPKRQSLLPARPRGAFSAKALENAMKQIVREYCTDIDCANRRRQGHTAINPCSHSDLAFRDHTCKKTVVLAITKDNVDAPPTLFKTYDSSAAFNNCTLWQVARATSAATNFFKSIKVGRDGIEFIDAGLGYNNPCRILIQEAQREFPERGEMRILSIGTGLGDVVTINDKRISIINALKRMASSSKKVAADVDHHYGGDGQYFRFNVDQGLQDITLSDWDKASNISAHTRNYLADNERLINSFVDTFTRSSVSASRNGSERNYNDILQTETRSDASNQIPNGNTQRSMSYSTHLPTYKVDISSPETPLLLSHVDGEPLRGPSITEFESQPYQQPRHRGKLFRRPVNFRENNRCSVCSSKMHHTHECPWSGMGHLRCFNCEFCSLLRSGMPSLQKLRGQQFGHYKQYCKPEAPCRKCRSKGHWEGQCLYEEGDEGCFECGQYDHWARDCPWKREFARETRWISQ